MALSMIFWTFQIILTQENYYKLIIKIIQDCKIILMIKEVVEVLTKKELDQITEHDFKWLIEKSILFYEAQRSGNLTEDNRVKWRGNSLWFDKGTRNF